MRSVDMLRRHAVVYFFLSLLAMCHPSWSSARDGLTGNTEHFVFHYWPQDTPSATNLLAVAEREFERVVDVIGYRPQEKIQVYVARDAREFRLLTRGQAPEWGIGVAVPAQGRIVLISPQHLPQQADLRQILVHELSHVVLGQAVGEATAPRWLDEGLAMFISHEWKMGQSILLARALLFDNLIPLENISQVNTYKHPRVDLAYAESFLAVAFISQRFGESSLHQMIRELARHGDIDLAMRLSLGMTYREFELVWHDYVASRFNWASALSHPIVLWTFILVLFLGVFLLKRQHTRKTMKKWRLAESSVGQWSTDEHSQEERSSP